MEITKFKNIYTGSIFEIEKTFDEKGKPSKLYKIFKERDSLEEIKDKQNSNKPPNEETPNKPPTGSNSGRKPPEDIK